MSGTYGRFEGRIWQQCEVNLPKPQLYCCEWSFNRLSMPRIAKISKPYMQRGVCSGLKVGIIIGGIARC